MRDINLAKKVFEEIYRNYDGYQISSADKANLGITSSDFVYGEISFDGFINLLSKINPNEEDIFYDLGSGLGKPCLAISLVYKIKKAIGLELLPSLLKASQEIALKAKSYFPDLNEIEFRKEDYLKADFSDGTIIFAHITCLPDEEVKILEEKFLKLNKGARIIVITKRLENSQDLKIIDEGEVRMNWGIATYRIYQRI